VADGPYRYVRNPLYLANLILTAGYGVGASRLGFLFMIAAMWLFGYRLIVREEEGLLEAQGSSFAAYMKAVPRLWPSITPRIAGSGKRPQWAQALAAEMFFWLIGVAVLSFAITMNIVVAGVVLLLGLAFFFIAVPLVKRARLRRGKIF